MEKKSFGLLLLLILVLASHEEGMIVGTEARTCESQSHKFKHACLVDDNCASVCKTEGFMGGKCRGFRHRCFCTRNC
ncbi:Defensin sd2 [Turnera subulata]|uniref:Defensin sd2 n=1 Tax=Turnera subulata TaxID=218843 RepID=A0A9Q0G9I2_9ROSI|nr:Defensin sd2 [Turnera subulata]